MWIARIERMLGGCVRGNGTARSETRSKRSIMDVYFLGFDNNETNIVIQIVNPLFHDAPSKRLQGVDSQDVDQSSI